jgi:hypothetical protein
LSWTRRPRNRAWSGTNVEVIAEIAASAAVQEGLNELLQHARGISAAVLDTLDVPPEDTIAERLDEARKAFVASWKGKVMRDGNTFTIRCEIAPHPVDTGVKLEAGLATGALIEWPRGIAMLYYRSANMPRACTRISCSFGYPSTESIALGFNASKSSPR